MAPVWYFARDDQERGPFTESQMKTLVSAGKLRQFDLVWKEGTSDWVMVSEADELHVPALEPPAPHESGSSPDATRESLEIAPAERDPETRAPLAPTVSPVARESYRTARAIAYLLIAIGLLGAMAAKGWESLALRNVQRLDAIVALQNSQFEAAWNERLGKLQGERRELQDARVFDAMKQGRLNQLENEIHQLVLNRDTNRSELQQGLWREQRERAATANQYDKVWGFWRQLAFTVASAVFSAGLLTMGLIGEMTERAISLLIIGVIAYSLFIGGAAWK